MNYKLDDKTYYDCENTTVTVIILFFREVIPPLS